MIAFVLDLALTLPTLIILLCLGVILEHAEAHGWAIFFGICATVIAFFKFNFTVAEIAVTTVAYFIVGFTWSFWRYKRYVDSRIAFTLQRYSTESSKKDALRSLHPTAMLGTITSWVLIWPFSMIESLTGDILNLIETMVKTTFKRVYFSIFNSAAAKLGVDPVKD